MSSGKIEFIGDDPFQMPIVKSAIAKAVTGAVQLDLTVVDHGEEKLVYVTIPASFADAVGSACSKAAREHDKG